MALWHRIRAWFVGAGPRLPIAPDRPTSRERGAGRYQPLYRYLRDRYADRVVLRFSEIEDVLGFALPPAARIAKEWWSGGELSNDASLLGDRSVVVDLSTQVVVYERRTVPRT